MGIFDFLSKPINSPKPGANAAFNALAGKPANASYAADLAPSKPVVPQYSKKTESPLVLSAKYSQSKPGTPSQDEIFSRGERISQGKKSLIDRLPAPIRAPAQQIKEGLVGRGQDVDFAGKLKETGGLLKPQTAQEAAINPFFSVGSFVKSQQERYFSLYDSLVSSGISKQRAAEIAEDKAFHSSTIDNATDAIEAVKSGTSKPKIAALSPQEESAVRAHAISDKISQSLDAIGSLPGGAFAGTVGRDAAKIIAGSRDIELISNTLRKEIPNLTEEAGNAFARALKDVDNPEEVSNIIKRVNHQVNAAKPLAQEATEATNFISKPISETTAVAKIADKAPSVLPELSKPISSVIGAPKAELEAARPIKTPVEEPKSVPKYQPLTTGPKAEVEPLRKSLQEVIEKHAPGSSVELVFNPKLSEETGRVGQYKTYKDVLSDQMRHVIEVQESGGKAPARVAFHETWHHLEQAMPAERLQELRTQTLETMTDSDKRYYASQGYATPEEQASEFMADEWGKEQADKAGYKSRIRVVLDKINEFIEGVKNSAKELYARMTGPEGRRGFAKNPFSPSEEANFNTKMSSLTETESAAEGELSAAEDASKGLPKDSPEYQDMKLKEKRFSIARSNVKAFKEAMEEAGIKPAKWEQPSAKPKAIKAQIAKNRDFIADRMTEISRDSRERLPAMQAETAGTELGDLERSTPVTAEEFERLNKSFSYENTIVDTNTPVKYKVNLLDYLRTPDRVLEKIGLGKLGGDIRNAWEAYLAELPVHIDIISDWAKRVPGEEANKRIFRWLDGQEHRDFHADKAFTALEGEELKVAKEIKEYLADWATRLGLPEDNQISHYITHIFALGDVEKEFPEEIADLIRDKVPSSVYDPFLEKRLGRKGYIEDTWKALDAYVKRGTRKSHMDPVLERLNRAVTDNSGNSRVDESIFDFVKAYADRINMRPTKVDTLVDNWIKSTPIGYKLGGRPTAYLSRQARQWVYRSMIGGNIGSAIRNLTQGVNTYAKLGEAWTAKGYIDLLTKGFSKELEDVGILKQDMVQDRTLSATKKLLGTIDKGLFAAFDLAERVNRGAAYFGAKAKALHQGRSEADAIEFAKGIVRDTQFQFGSVDTPVALNSDLVKVAAQFMTYGLKQAEFAAEAIAKKDLAGILRYIAGSILITYLFGEAFNIKGTDFIPGYGFTKFGPPPSLNLPIELFKALADSPDDYGNDRSVGRKIEDVGRAIPFPGSVQFWKTYQGAGGPDISDMISPPKREKKKTDFGDLSVPDQARSLIYGKPFPEDDKKSSGSGNLPPLPKLPALPKVQAPSVKTSTKPLPKLPKLEKLPAIK